jgi:site-specific recombinase XerC
LGIIDAPNNQRKECTISKNQSHTFATAVTLTNGVPIESVSKMLGHRNIKSTQHYARVVDQKVGEDMERLALKLESKLAKVS